jgi:hypothetical protein
MSLDFLKVMIALADWAGHTQKECATLTFDEIVEVKGEMFIERDRNKTGVSGRWWIPPEAAEVIRRVVARTPRDAEVNPHGLAFLTPKRLPLVRRSSKGRHARNDYVRKEWESLLRAAKHYGVRPISFKFMRKGTAQFIRDKYNKEISRAFLAHADEDVQDESYTRTSLAKVERATRQYYKQMKEMFQPITAAEWPAITEAIQRQNGKIADMSALAA